MLLHHIDGIRAAGPEKTLAQLFEKELPRLCEVQAGELEREGTAVEYLGRTKIQQRMRSSQCQMNVITRP